MSDPCRPTALVALALACASLGAGCGQGGDRTGTRPPTEAGALGAQGDGGGDTGGFAFGGGEDASFPSGSLDAGLSSAIRDCLPPCGAGDFCFAISYGGGGRVPFSLGDAGDGSTGCNPPPPACAPAPECACLLATFGQSSGCSVVDCVTDDAGRPTVECIVILP